MRDAIVKEEIERAAALKAQIKALQDELRSIERCEDVFFEAKEKIETGAGEYTGKLYRNTGKPIYRFLPAKSSADVMTHINWICRAAVFNECKIVKNKNGMSTRNLPTIADMTDAQRKVAKLLANKIADAFVCAVQERAWEDISDETARN